MIQSMTIMAFEDGGRTEEIAYRIGIEADHEPDPGTTIYGQCCDCGQMSWYHVDSSPVDVRDLIVHAACCDDDTVFVPGLQGHERVICR